ncbi:hypothetical protein [Kushneria konosiri]|uniref:hypothetical protein n=1 Tax=Kushneria konosiri TaxID=698828 RepID=UPI001314BA1E|nr:hypothetical protein [Kushneria konosiri]
MTPADHERRALMVHQQAMRFHASAIIMERPDTTLPTPDEMLSALISGYAVGSYYIH